MRYEYINSELVLTSKTIKINQKFDPVNRRMFKDEKEALEWGKKYIADIYDKKFYVASFKITTKKDEKVEVIEKNKKYKLTITRDENINTKDCFLIVNDEEHELEFEDGEAELFIKFKDDENILDIEETGEYIMLMPMEKVIAK